MLMFSGKDSLMLRLDTLGLFIVLFVLFAIAVGKDNMSLETPLDLQLSKDK